MLFSAICAHYGPCRSRSGVCGEGLHSAHSKRHVFILLVTDVNIGVCVYGPAFAKVDFATQIEIPTQGDRTGSSLVQGSRVWDGKGPRQALFPGGGEGLVIVFFPRR